MTHTPPRSTPDFDTRRSNLALAVSLATTGRVGSDDITRLAREFDLHLAADPAVPPVHGHAVTTERFSERGTDGLRAIEFVGVDPIGVRVFHAGGTYRITPEVDPE